MALKKTANTDLIFKYLTETMGMTVKGACGFLANIYSESQCQFNAVEVLLLQRYTEDGQTCWKKPYWENFEYNNKLYTSKVDSGEISKEEFLNPRNGKQYGYGGVMLTSRSRKTLLWNNTKAKGLSIADPQGQLATLKYELENTYKSTLAKCKSSASAEDCAEFVLRNFEQPTITSSVVATRRGYATEYYNLYKTDKVVSTVAIDYDKYINSTGTHYISNSGSDENGKYRNGKAGDQTGKEWQMRSWYNRPWNCVLRHPDEKVRRLLVELSIEAALNNLIGYDQNERYTYWDHLKASNYRPSQITIACEADCSAGVIANTKAVGYLLGNTTLQNCQATYTGNMRSVYKAMGFEVLTDSKYTGSSDYLLPGDILLFDAAHTATNVTYGSKVRGSSTPTPTTPSQVKPQTQYSETVQWNGVINKDNAPVRKGAGKKYDKLVSYPTLPKGTVVGVCDTTKSAAGNKWYFIKINDKYGFIYSKYVTKTSTQMVVTVSEGSTLAVRKWAGTEYDQLTSCPTLENGTELTYINTTKDTKGNDWYFVSFDHNGETIKGFVYAKYVKYI